MTARDPQVLEIEAVLAATFRRFDSHLRRAHFLACRMTIAHGVSGTARPMTGPGASEGGASELRMRSVEYSSHLPT